MLFGAIGVLAVLERKSNFSVFKPYFMGLLWSNVVENVVKKVPLCSR